MKNLIVCAANKYIVTKPNGDQETITIADSCHFGKSMQPIIKLLKEAGYELTPDKKCGDRGQGFLDESGNYHNRSEAYKIAISSGQPFNPEYTLPNKRLDSNCIRHFDESKSLKDYMED